MEGTFKTIVAVGGATASYFFGGWSALLNILLIFVIMDYITGFLAAAKEGKLNSETGLWGIAKKMALFAIVAVAHMVDSALGDAHFFRDLAIFFYLSNEFLSITENAGRLGVPIPEKLRGAVEVLRGRGEVK